MITLTTWTKNYETPRDAFEQAGPQVAQLVRRLRRRHGDIEYLKVLEQHKNGFPHWHMVVRSGYIPFTAIRDEWKALTGNLIVDVRKIKDQKGVYFYIVKYLGKQSICKFTKRRVSWSKNFFPPKEKREGVSLNVHELQFEDIHPSELLTSIASGREVFKITRDVMVLDPNEDLINRFSA